MRTVEVEIFNARFTVREADNAAYLQALAAEVDARIQQIYETYPTHLSLAGRDHGRLSVRR
jgi:cell division protein ZapA (FtsZ GTPase activity inhibitor)